MTPPTSTAILQIEQITRQFAGSSAPAVANLSLTLTQGDILGLLGPSGCGKTTLLRIIAGFEQHQSGVVKLAGQTVSQGSTWVPPERRSIGMVFQDFALFPHLTVADNVAFGLKHLGRKQSEQRQGRVSEAIALVGLDGMENRFPHELSGGQQQRVALARALAPRPTLILLDEPLSNLDVQVRLYLRHEVRDILKSTGTSGIFVTHDQEEALSIADQVAVMRQGKLEQLGTPEEIYQDPASRFVAEFVTQANFLPAQRQEQMWESELGAFPIDPIHCTCQAVWDICQRESLPGDLMIRQEDLRLEAAPDGEVIVRDRHFLGREYCYFLQTHSGRGLQARTSMDVRFAVGDRVKVSPVHPNLRFFPNQGSEALGVMAGAIGA